MTTGRQDNSVESLIGDDAGRVAILEDATAHADSDEEQRIWNEFLVEFGRECAARQGATVIGAKSKQAHEPAQPSKGWEYAATTANALAPLAQNLLQKYAGFPKPETPRASPAPTKPESRWPAVALGVGVGAALLGLAMVLMRRR